MTTTKTRKTFQIKNDILDDNRRLININIYGGTSWKEAFEACVGFLNDEDMSSSYFAAVDLEFLIEAAKERLRQVNARLENIHG